MASRVFFLIFLFFVLGMDAQECPVDIPDEERRDCWFWEGASQLKCEARGCLWCESQQEGFPWCFYDDTVCPSEIPEDDRVDCLAGEPDINKDVCNRRGCIWCATESTGIPFCFYDDDANQGGEYCPGEIDTNERIDCHPEEGAGHDECLARGCYWCEDVAEGVPWCFAPQEHGYRMVGDPVETAKGWRVDLRRVSYPSWFGADIEYIQLDVEFNTADRLRIKFTDPSSERFEVPIVIESPDSKPPTTQYDVEFINDPVFAIKVTRISTGSVIFDTTIGGLYYSEQFLEIVTYLNSDKVYGFGEHEHHSFRHDMNYVKWGMWARDQMVSESNLYGVQPFYMNIEQTNDAHGVLFLNSNAQDVVLMPKPAITYRTIGGVLDIYLFLGPSPENVVQQYTEAIGRPVMVPYWSLGFQLCRWGYENIDHMKAAVNRMRQYDIPHDIQYGDIDYMRDYLDFTVDYDNFAGLPEYVQDLKGEGTRYIIILDPGISYTQPPGTYLSFERGDAMNVWIMDPTNSFPARGIVWPGEVYYPDYTKEETDDWWTEECKIFYQELEFAGLWIDMNEPSNFTDMDPGVSGCNLTSPLNRPVYVPYIADFLLEEKTICMDTMQGLGRHYNAHSLYGWSMSKSSLRAARETTGKRSIVYSRSTFPGTGSYAQHWLGDNWSRWSNMRWSIIGMMDFNLFGFPYVGADICGFQEVTTETLCMRWQELGAFYTFSRNHNAAGNPDQDPGIWPEVARVTRETLHIRYTLLPYLYTLFHKAHTQGSTVIRPLMNEFHQDTVTHDLHDQFLWGPAFLISPVLDQNVYSVDAYFPYARWYSYYDGMEVGVQGGFQTIDAPIDFIPLHVRGGYILPTQQPSNSTMWSRLLPMGLIVALDDNGMATGDLFWDDGESQDTYQNAEYFSANYEVSGGSLSGIITHDGYTGVDTLQFGDMRIMGEDATISSVLVNGQVHSSWTQDDDTQEIDITELTVNVNSEWDISWS